MKQILCNQIKDNLNITTAILYYKLAYVYNLQNLNETTMMYIERCFSVVAETRSFLELDFSLVKKILYSSELHITSEIEVFNAVDVWVSYKTEERRSFAEELLLTVRLPLLSDLALNYLLSKSSLCKINECKAMIESVLHNRENIVKKHSSITSRHCNQRLFNILVCEKSQGVRSLKQINCEASKSITTYDTVAEADRLLKAVCLKGDIYIFVMNSILVVNTMIKLKKYSKSFSTWEDVVDLNYRHGFCACVLINEIMVIGGVSKREVRGEIIYEHLNSCIHYDTNDLKCNEVSNMNQSRHEAACTVYDGKIVVSGGLSDIRNQYIELTDTVEIYDHIANRWSNMPSMVKIRNNHSLVAIKSKLYVIGSNCRTCEVFDKTTNKFTMFKAPPSLNYHFSKVGATSIGNKIVVFGKDDSKILLYDTDNDDWNEESCEQLKGHFYTSCIKMPQM